MTKAKRLGILGGTFDPIHIGHLATAEAVRCEYQLDTVLFIPSANPPHKQDVEVTDAIHRYRMTELATKSNPHFEVSAIEMERKGLSYTINTLQALLEEYGDDTELYFIIGSDALAELHTWENIYGVLELTHFIAASRPGIDKTDEIIASFGELGRKKIHRLTIPELEISATDIRHRVAEGRSIRYIVPEAVRLYIAEHVLYQTKK